MSVPTGSFVDRRAMTYAACTCRRPGWIWFMPAPQTKPLMRPWRVPLWWGWNMHRLGCTVVLVMLISIGLYLVSMGITWVCPLIILMSILLAL